MIIQRRLPVGAEPKDGGVHFRVWAPQSRRVAVLLDDGAEFALKAEKDGYWSGFSEAARTGMFYRYRLDTVATKGQVNIRLQTHVHASDEDEGVEADPEPKGVSHAGGFCF